MIFQFSIYSLIVSCFISTVLIGIFGIILNCKKAFHLVDINILSIMFITILARLLFPFNVGLFRINTQNEFILKTKIVENLSFWNIFLFVWFLGFLLAMSLYLLKIKNNQNILNHIYKDPKRKVLKNFQFPVLISEYVPGPMILGTKKIVLMPNINYSDQERSIIIAHEIQHIKNKDIYIKLFLSFISAIYWWFIPLYFFKKYAATFLELRVDHALVTKKTNFSKQLYLESLISVSKKNNSISLEATNLSSSLLTELQTRVYYLIFSKEQKYSIHLAGFLIALSIIPSIIEFVPSQIFFQQSINTVESVKFNGLESTDKVIQIPNGGWLYGEADISSGFLFNFKTEHFNSNTDPNAISVKELEQ